MSHTLTLDAVQTVAADCLIANGASALQAAAVAHSIREAEAEGTRGHRAGLSALYCGHLRVGKIAGQAVPVVAPARARRGAGRCLRRLFASGLRGGRGRPCRRCPAARASP